MVSILESPEIRQLVAPISVELYHRSGEYSPNGLRTELIRGVIVEKMPKSPLHVALLRRLFRSIQAALADRAGLLVSKEDPLTFNDSEPEPDISVIEGSESDFDVVHPSSALLAIEVAVTTEQLDRAKAFIYAEASVNEYWLVLANGRQIEVYSQPEAGVYQRKRIYAQGEIVTSSAAPELTIDLAQLFQNL